MRAGKAVCAKHRQSGMIQPSVQGRHEGDAQRPQQWNVYPIDMCMYDIEVIRQFCDPRQHCSIGSGLLRSSRNAFGEQDSRIALVTESSEASSVTAWPISTSSSVNQNTTRSVPPYSLGGTASANGAIWAMRI